MKLIQELMQLEADISEGKNTPWDILNDLADSQYGEFGFATLDSDDAEDLVDMSKADLLAKKRGKEGLMTMDEADMKRLVNANPSLLIGKAAKALKKTVTEGVFKDLHVDLLDAIHAEFKVDDDMADLIADYVLTGNDNDKVESFLYEHFVKNGEMPYGVQKARDGDPSTWIADKLTDIFKNEVKAIFDAEKTVKEDWGTSDWNIALRHVESQLAAGSSLDAAIASAAEWFYEDMGYDSVEEAVDAIKDMGKRRHCSWAE